MNDYKSQPKIGSPENASGIFWTKEVLRKSCILKYYHKVENLSLKPVFQKHMLRINLDVGIHCTDKIQPFEPTLS